MLSKRSNLTEKQEKFLTEKKYWCIFLSIPIQLFLHFLHSLINCHKISMIQMDIFFKVRILTLIHLLISGDPQVDYIPFPQ